jgi:hypothetical protein
MIIRVRNFKIEIKNYGWKKNKSEFKIGDKVKCRFGNSGHKFYPELREELTITKMKYAWYSGYWDLYFNNGKHNFCENDFQKENK